MIIAMIDDKFVSPADLTPAQLDRGIFFGDGVYEVLRSYNGRLFALDEHMQRFANSLAGVHITGIELDVIRQRVISAYELSGLDDARIYFHVTRGSGPREHICRPGMKPTFFLTVDRLGSAKKIKEHGIAVSTHPDWRWKRCDIKSLNLLANVLARQDAASKGCAEAILTDEQGLITEGAASAFFAVIDSVLYTSALGPKVLPSITRKYVLAAAANLKIPIEELSITAAQAANADEAFMAVTTKDIVPIVTFDGKTVADGKPGPITQALMAEFQKFTE